MLIIDTGSSQKLYSARLSIGNDEINSNKFDSQILLFPPRASLYHPIVLLANHRLRLYRYWRLWPILGTRRISRSSSRSVRKYTFDIRNAIHATLEILRDAIMKFQGRSWPGILAMQYILYIIHFCFLDYTYNGFVSKNLTVGGKL